MISLYSNEKVYPGGEEGSLNNNKVVKRKENRISTIQEHVRKVPLSARNSSCISFKSFTCVTTRTLDNADINHNWKEDRGMVMVRTSLGIHKHA